MRNHIRDTTTYQALVNCLVRKLQKERRNILKRVDTRGPITKDNWQDSNALEQVDHALTEIGQFDTK